MSIVQHVSIPNVDTFSEENITLFKSRLETKREELIPLVAFFEELKQGWEKRIAVASQVLSLQANRPKEDVKKLQELIKIAQLEVKRIDDTFLEVSKISDELRVKIQDLDMIALRKISEVPGVSFLIDVDSINRAVHQADALIEIRQNKIKELTQ